MRKTILMCLVVLAACSKEPAPTLQGAEANAPRPVAEQEKELAARFAEQKAALDAQSRQQGARAERSRYTDLVKGVAVRFIEARNEASKTGRSDMAGPLAKLEAIKREAEQVDVDGCTGPVRTTLVAAIAKTIETLTHFSQQTGEPDAKSQEGARAAQALLGEADDKLATCVANS